ncbi:8939_t:CDS:1 [Entrophospora sp. SA101]|nr:13317_t:CDS:1 [Entrophospora sp. SA101]CAJ0761680.1 8939_t:CDS:1 [Entrophospora sp. SA101]
MTNIQEFKNKLQEYQEGTDYIYDESKKTYIIRHGELKNTFWGDASNEVEYKAIEDSRGNMQFQKSAIFRSSKEKKEGVDQAPFVHSVEKMRDKQWKEKNLGNFPKTIPTLPPNSQNEKDNSHQTEANFPEEIEEEFGYYKQ